MDSCKRKDVGDEDDDSCHKRKKFDLRTAMPASSSMSSPSTDKKKKKKKSKKKHRRSMSSSSTSSDESSGRHHGRKKHKKKSKQKSNKSDKTKSSEKSKERNLKDDSSSEELIGPNPICMISDNMKPLTKEEWEKQQSVVRKVYDEETGRNRLVRGDGEIIEEMVSYNQHKEINKAATLADGMDFKKKTGLRYRP
ncbi:ADP-ribosylation factor-like protein 6-interacting protein 4 [Chamberlinius hualienensis]